MRELAEAKMKIPGHVDTARVQLSTAEVERAIDHGNKLAAKIAAHQRQRGWYRTRYNAAADSGKLSDMCVAGVMGEYGARKYFGLPVPQDIVINLDHFDGGRDVVLRNGYRIQVKSVLNPEKLRPDKLPWLLSPRRSNAVDPDKCDAVALTMPHVDSGVVDMVGFLVIADWMRLKEPFDFDPDYAVGVRGDRLLPMRHLWFAEVWKNA